MVFHCVVLGHLSGVLDADGLSEGQLRGYWPVGRLGLLRLHGEPVVEPRQEVLEDFVGLIHGGSASQAQLGDQPLLEGADAIRSTRPLACGDMAKICRMPSSRITRANWVDS